MISKHAKFENIHFEMKKLIKVTSEFILSIKFVS